MLSATDYAFPRVGALVERAERRSGSRMLAYGDVGRTIGATGSWVRKFLGRQPIRLDADTFLKIQAAYDAECARWEAEAACERARFFALGEDCNAMGVGKVRRVDVARGADASRSGRAPAVVAALVDEVGQ